MPPSLSGAPSPTGGRSPRSTGCPPDAAPGASGSKSSSSASSAGCADRAATRRVSRSTRAVSALSRTTCPFLAPPPARAYSCVPGEDRNQNSPSRSHCGQPAPAGSPRSTVSVIICADFETYVPWKPRADGRAGGRIGRRRLVAACRRREHEGQQQDREHAGSARHAHVLPHPVARATRISADARAGDAGRSPGSCRPVWRPGRDRSCPCRSGSAHGSGTSRLPLRRVRRR